MKTTNPITLVCLLISMLFVLGATASGPKDFNQLNQKLKSNSDKKNLKSLLLQIDLTCNKSQSVLIDYKPNLL